jgi:hypothetical protein
LKQRKLLAKFNILSDERMKALKNLEIDGMHLTIIKVICNKFIATIIQNDKNLESFLIVRNETKGPLSPLSFDLLLEL